MNRAERMRSMYPDGRPNDEARAIHRRYIAGPLPRILPIAAVLEVRGRTSGAVTRIPIVTVRYHGDWYVVSMFGEKPQWVKNIRAANGEGVLTHGRRRPVRLVEVASDERPSIIKRYLFFALGARPHMDVRWNDPPSAFVDVADTYPVFRVDPR